MLKCKGPPSFYRRLCNLSSQLKKLAINPSKLLMLWYIISPLSFSSKTLTLLVQKMYEKMTKKPLFLSLMMIDQMYFFS